MNVHKLYAALMAFALAGCSTWASTNVVVQGANFQSAINSASAGDTLVVQSGIYPGNLNFTKALTVVCSGSQIQFTGNVTVTNASAVSFSQTQFVGSLQVATNVTLVLSQSVCSNGLILAGGSVQAFDTLLEGVISTGGKVTLKRCNLDTSNILLTNSSFEGLRVTGSSFAITGTAPVGTGTRFVLVQSCPAHVTLTGCSAWLGYNGPFITNNPGSPPFPSSDVSLINCDSTLVGNIISSIFKNGTITDPSTGGVVVGTLYQQGGTLKAFNNVVSTINDHTTGQSVNCIWIRSGAAQLINNTVFDYMGGSGTVQCAEAGILVTDGGGPVVIRGDICEVTGSGNLNGFTASQYTAGVVQDGQQISELSFCCVRNDVSARPPIFGVSALNCLLGVDPVINAGTVNLDFTLLAGSPCFNAGPPDAIYNNTDGTRNTMGFTGGPVWNPASKTNNNPMVFFLGATNQTVLKGLQSTVLINVGASAGH